MESGARATGSQLEVVREEHQDLLLLVERLEGLVSAGIAGDDACLWRAGEVAGALKSLLVDLHYPRERSLVERAGATDVESLRAFHYRHDLAARLLQGMCSELARESVGWQRFCSAAETLGDLLRVLVVEEEQLLGISPA